MSNLNKFERLEEDGFNLQKFKRPDGGGFNLNKVEGNVVGGFQYMWLDVGSATSRFAPSSFWV